MPMSPLKPCPHPGCSQLTSGGRCEQHKRKAWERDEKPKRMRGRRLQKEREAGLRRNPICQVCHREPSSIRDHVTPLAEGGKDDSSNIQYICVDCHDKKTQEEAKLS